ncbi:putative GABA permease [Pleurostoma richardsiae]|uniref:GABA permease n=1 Tax=Pleurostoma richardsiae TaxID=41990 RepID=A0AA38VGE1_9PEZI|nr:putative GABA permease [Pleurostoma richardsiae]
MGKESPIPRAPTTSVTEAATEAATERKVKKQFNFWTALGIAICTSGAWEGWVASIGQGIVGGGAVGLVWGWVFVSVGITCMAATLGEFASMWPSAGAQYVWASHLSPRKYARLVSWFTAWISIAGLWLGSLSCSMGVAVQIQSYAASASNYAPLTWHAFLINVACLACWVAVNIFYVKFLHYMNSFILVVHVVGYLITIGLLTGLTKNKHDATYVFTDFHSYTGWDNDFVSWSISLLSALYAFFSIDAAAHFAEEIPKANVAVPRAMILQASSSAISTFPLVIAVVFCSQDLAQVLASPIGLMSPFTQMFIDATGSVPLAIFVNGLSTSVAFAAGFDLWGAASRSLWSMARDGGLPAWLGRVDEKGNLNFVVNLIMIPPSVIIYMIYIWNTTAFYGIMAGVLVALQISYVIPLALNLFYARRNLPLERGPFHLGYFTPFVNALGLVFGCFMIVFMSFPVYRPVTATSRNYASTLIGAIIIFSVLGWFFYGKKNYQGALEIIDAEAPADEVEKNTEGQPSRYAQATEIRV